MKSDEVKQEVGVAAQEANEGENVVEEASTEQVSANGLSEKRPSKGRFFVSAKIRGQVVPVLIDTGADISLAPTRYADMGVKARLRKPFDIKAYDGLSKTRITETSTVTLDFGNVSSNIEFFSTEVEFMIIGADLLRSTDKRMSLNTKTDTFKVKDTTMSTYGSAEEAVRFWKKEGDSENAYDKKRWATINKTTTIPAWSSASVKVTANGDGDLFLSLFDSDDEKIFIPSMNMDNNNNHTFWTKIENKQDKSVTLERGTPVGKMADTSDPNSGVFSYTANEVEGTLEELFEEERVAAAAAAAAATEPGQSTNASAESASAKGEAGEKGKLEEDESGNGPVKMSDIINKNKIDNETLEKCRKNGIMCVSYSKIS